MAQTRYNALIRHFARVKVLVCGDLILDQFIWGKVNRISPEAPVPVVQVTTESFRLGGAANVASNIRSLGGQAVVCGVLGRDTHGKKVLDQLAEIGADARGVFSGRHDQTTRKTRIIAHQQQVVRLDREDGARNQSRAAARARLFLLANLWKVDVVVISDYAKGVVNAALLHALAVARRKRNFCLVIDPKDANFPHYRAPTLITPNRDEASRAAGIPIDHGASLLRAGAELLKRWEADAVLITRGEEGMSLFRKDAPPRHFPTVARQVFDVTGAGDTVLATCALALGAGAAPEDAAVLANHAAGIVVGKVGTASVTARQLLDDLRKDRDRGRRLSRG